MNFYEEEETQSCVSLVTKKFRCSALTNIYNIPTDSCSRAAGRKTLPPTLVGPPCSCRQQRPSSLQHASLHHFLHPEGYTVGLEMTYKAPFLTYKTYKASISWLLNQQDWHKSGHSALDCTVHALTAPAATSPCCCFLCSPLDNPPVQAGLCTLGKYTAREPHSLNLPLHPCSYCFLDHPPTLLTVCSLLINNIGGSMSTFLLFSEPEFSSFPKHIDYILIWSNFAGYLKDLIC